MTLGNYDSSRHQKMAKAETFSYSPSQNQYKITVESIRVDKNILPISKEVINQGQGVFVDSGTTLIHGPSQIIKYDLLMQRPL